MILYFLTVQNGGKIMNKCKEEGWLHLRSESLQQFSLNVCLVWWINLTALITVDRPSLIFIKTSVHAGLFSATSGFKLISSLVILIIMMLTMRFDFSMLLHTFFLVPFSVTETFLLIFLPFLCPQVKVERRRVPDCSQKGFFVHASEVPALTTYD